MPFVRGAHLRSHAARPYTFSNSPVNGLLYVRGTIGRLGPCTTCLLTCNGAASQHYCAQPLDTYRQLLAILQGHRSAAGETVMQHRA